MTESAPADLRELSALHTQRLTLRVFVPHDAPAVQRLAGEREGKAWSAP